MMPKCVHCPSRSQTIFGSTPHSPRSRYLNRCNRSWLPVYARSAEHSRYIMEVGLAKRPEGIETLLQVLKSQGQEIVAPYQREGLHPLAIPLSRGPAFKHSSGAFSKGDWVYTCLLRWPASAATQNLPVIIMSQGAPTVSMLARSVKEYLVRALAEEDCRGEVTAIAEALGPSAQDLYSRGSVKKSGLPSSNAWLTKQSYLYPEVVESLVMSHLEKGDVMSAMITGEWYMKRVHFAGWARPYEFNARLYSKLERAEEARDSARVALYMPWWTLRDGFAATAELAQFTASASEVQRRLSEVAKASQGGTLPPDLELASKTDEQACYFYTDYKRTPKHKLLLKTVYHCQCHKSFGQASLRTLKDILRAGFFLQMAIDEAERLMNLVAAGEAEWDDIRLELAEKYRLGRQRAIYDFIVAA